MLREKPDWELIGIIVVKLAFGFVAVYVGLHFVVKYW
jgi:hypothetical protein